MNSRNKPLISIVTVSYNSSVTIGDTIKGVLAQEYSDLEYIIIDGGSKDSTVNIAESFKHLFLERGIKYTIVSERDHGIYDAMNKGIQLATGDWIGIINSDDYYEPNAVLQLVAGINNDPQAELFYGNMNMVDEESSKTGEIKPIAKLSDMVINMTIFHPTVFIKKEVYNRFGLYDLKYRLTADWDLLKRLYVNGIKFKYIDSTFSNFRRGGSGSGFKKVHLVERLEIRHKSFKLYFLWYDFKDLLIFIYYLLFPKRSLF